jgi:hypothetical protein
MKNFIFYSIKSAQDYWRTFRCRFNVRSLALPLLLAAILMTAYTANAQNIQGLAPVLWPKGGFAVDGNAFVDGVNPTWGDFLFASQSAPVGDPPGGIFKPTPPLIGGLPYTYPPGPLPTPGETDADSFYVYPYTTFLRDDITNNDPTTFTGSNKIFDPVSTHEWGKSPSPNKNEIQNTIAHFSYADKDLPYGNEGDLWLIFAADRQSTAGSSYIDFEILQEPLTMLKTGTDSKGFDKGIFASEATSVSNPSGRSEGDLLITLEFTQGGVSANVFVREWNGTAYSDPITPDEGTVFATNNSGQTIVPYPIYDQAPITTDPVNLWAYEANQWAEGAVNLTSFFRNEACFAISSLFVRTRSSGNSGTSELKDFPGEPFQLNLCIDSEAPEFTGPLPPATASYQCKDDVPAPDNLGYTDNCLDDGSVPGVDVSDGLTCPETITRTWTITDCGNNITTYTQIITVDDTTDPVFDPAPDAASYQCRDDVPAPGNLGYTDNCDDPGSVLGSDVSDGNTCPETITRTWTFTDLCGNDASVSQIITVDDTTDPVFDPAPDAASYQCRDDVPAPGNLGYTDNCDDPGSVLGSDVSDGNTCPETITRTWTFTDLCGNDASVSQIITVDDTTDPVFDPAPDAASYQCRDDVPAPGNLGYTDNCDDPGSVLGSDVSDGNTCPETITRTWTFTDLCGNDASVSQIITVDDTTDPEFTFCPEDKTIACDADVVFGDPIATDNCDATPTLGFEDSVVGDVHTRTWTATDDCGNTNATCSQSITIESCGHLFPTATTCCSFRNGSAQAFTQVCYSVAKGKVSNATPGVFFYYAKIVAPSDSFDLDVLQSKACANELGLFALQQDQIILWNENCDKAPNTTVTSTSAAKATIHVTGATVGDEYVISVKYDTKSIVGTKPNGNCEYTFVSQIGGANVSGSQGKIVATKDCQVGNISAGSCNSQTGAIAPTETTVSAKTSDSAGFEAYPVPFKDQLTIKYKFDYKSDVKIEVFNAQGISVLSKTDTNGYLNKEVILELYANKDQEQVYVVKVTTNRGSSTKKVMSSK